MSALTLSLAVWPGAAKWIGIAGLVTGVWVDPPLSADAQAWLEPPAEHLAPADNLYYWITGFDAPAHQSPLERGIEIHRVLAAADAAASAGGEFRYTEPAPDGDPLQFSNDAGTLCSFTEVECLGRVRADPEMVEALVDANSVLLDRYRRFAAVRGFQTLTPPRMEAPLMPLLGTVSQIHRLYLAQLALMTDDQTRIAMLSGDVAFVRRLLADADQLIIKMIAAHWLAEDLRLLAALMDGAPEHTLNARVAGSHPLSADELSIEASLKWELRLAASVLMVLERYPDYTPAATAPSALFGRIYKPRRTTNLWQRRLAAMSELAGMTPGEQLASGITIPEPTVFERLINPIGSRMITVGSPSFVPYGYRLRDLDGLLRLVELKRRLLSERISDDRVPDWLAAQGSEFTDPYTGQPMNWDPATHRLSFEGLGTRPAYREVFLAPGASTNE